MSRLERHIDLFDKYLKEGLSESERKDFEGRLKKDPDLNGLYNEYLKQVHLIKALGVREEMSKIIDQNEKSNKFKLRYFIPIGLAAALALTLIFLPKKAVDNITLFDEYFSPYPNAISGRSQELDIQKAMEFYDRNQFEQAIKAFNALGESNSVLFYKSVSHLAIKQPEQALASFNELNSDDVFYNESLWFRGLSFLLMNESDSILYYMKQIEKSNPKYEVASRIIEQTNSKK